MNDASYDEGPTPCSPQRDLHLFRLPYSPRVHPDGSLGMYEYLKREVEGLGGAVYVADMQQHVLFIGLVKMEHTTRLVGLDGVGTLETWVRPVPPSPDRCVNE